MDFKYFLYAKYFIVYALLMKTEIKPEADNCNVFSLKLLFLEDVIELLKEQKLNETINEPMIEKSNAERALEKADIRRKTIIIVLLSLLSITLIILILKKLRMESKF